MKDYFLRPYEVENDQVDLMTDLRGTNAFSKERRKRKKYNEEEPGICDNY